jgi:transcriptional regulator with GAF, ATPase, and Fis domain
LIESELFGHEKGAFTNAASQRMGRFEWARDGTIFLDEIGDLEPRLQTKLLRVLDDRAFERVGGTQTLRMRARVIAATSHDLRRMVREGRFRADLYYRLGVFHFSVPPLRERPEDLPELVADGFARLSRRLGREAPKVTDGFLSSLATHSWPGNVRELLNVLERLIVARPGAELRGEDLAAVLWEGEGRPEGMAGHGRPAPAPPDDGDGDWSLPAFIREVEAGERGEIIEALRASRGCIAAAARRLRIPRSTLRHRMKKHGISEP